MASVPHDLEPPVITGWNRFSRRFIDAPTFDILPRPVVRQYCATIEQSGEQFTIASEQPRLSLAPIWTKLRHGPFSLTIHFADAEGATHSLALRRTKAWDWQGHDNRRSDWAAAADRNIAFLIHAAEHGVAPYKEPGVPVWIWSSAGPEPDKGHPNGRGDAYPAAHQPVFIRAFLAHAQARRAHEREAMRLANFIGDWLLENRHAATGRLPLFPFSTIGMGKFEGGNEGAAVNITRACRTGEGMVDLYRATGREECLDYAQHLADTVMQFQRHDGSLPYRVDPAGGQVVEDYTCDTINFPVLVEMLEAHRPDAKRAFAARRAVDWMLAYPAATNHWQGAFEDVGEKQPFENLGNMGAILLICHLCRHANQRPDYLPAARRVNRFVEDQFVFFRTDEDIRVNCPVPQVTEQFVCFYVMEGHTANWINALLALHEATGEREFLDKAIAAGNAICLSQFPNGEFSTWGHDPETGQRGDTWANWYAGNALASEVLYKLDAYVRRFEG